MKFWNNKTQRNVASSGGHPSKHRPRSVLLNFTDRITYYWSNRFWMQYILKGQIYKLMVIKRDNK
jgi:hypothetical protein